jgi:hypothetical protein
LVFKGAFVLPLGAKKWLSKTSRNVNYLLYSAIADSFTERLGYLTQFARTKLQLHVEKYGFF